MSTEKWSPGRDERSPVALLPNPAPSPFPSPVPVGSSLLSFICIKSEINQRKDEK